MKLSSFKHVSVVFTLIFILCVLIKAREFGDFEQLTLEITTNVQEVLPMQPIPITITLSNNTEKPITGHNQIDPGTGFLKIYIAKANKPFEQFHSSDRPNLTGIRGEDVLKPGFRNSFSGYIFYAHPKNLEKEKRGQYLFESPGVYRIKATFKDFESKKIESNVLTIEAKEPGGENAAAYEYLKNLQDSEDKDVYYGNFLLMDFAGQKVLQKQEEFISRFPDSRYSRCLYYSLGLTYSARKERNDAQKGINMLEKTASYKDFFLAKEALLKLIEILEKQGRSDKAWKYKKIFARRYPDSEEGRDYIEEVHAAAVERRRYIWPLIPVGVAVGVFIFGYLPLLKKKAKTKGQ